MRVIHTGRVLSEVVRDIKRLRADPALKFEYHRLVLQDTFYRPPGVYIWPEPGLARPLSYRFPPPAHVLEVMVALRGVVVRETADDGARRSEGIVQAANVLRPANWLSATENFAKVLHYTVSQTRLLYHLLTPLYTNAGEPFSLWDLRWVLYEACGFAGARVLDAEVQQAGSPGHRPKCRMKFWGEEIQGDVEL